MLLKIEVNKKRSFYDLGSNILAKGGKELIYLND